MASFGLHLLVAEEYLKLHKIDGVEEFIKGNFAPDMVEDKVASHYSIYNKTMSYTDTLKNKVDLVQYVKHNDIDSDFNRNRLRRFLLPGPIAYTDIQGARHRLGDCNQQRYAASGYQVCRAGVERGYRY